MTLAKGASLALLLIGFGLLAACQSVSPAPPAEVPVDDWRVVERLGDARYLAPDTSIWAAAMPATTLPGGSRIVTGAGGRLMLSRAGDHITAGPASRFRLPDAAPGSVLEQAAGHLRYRLAGRAALAVGTPLLGIEAKDADFEVTTRVDTAAVTVARGQLRVATPDGQRAIRLEAGQSAHAGDQQALAFQRAEGQPSEPVERLILPALQSRPAGAEAGPPGPQAIAAGTSRGSTSAAAAVPSTVAVAMTDPGGGAAEGAAAPRALAAVPATAEAAFTTTAAGAVHPERAVLVDDPLLRPGPTAAVGAAPLPSAAMDDAPLLPEPPATVADGLPAPPADPTVEDAGPLFDRLTDGMVDGVPVEPSRNKPLPRGRSV